METVTGRREKKWFSLGKNEFLVGIVVPTRRARTNGPPPSGPPSGEKVRVEEGGRDLGGDFSEKVLRTKRTGVEREGHSIPPFLFLPPLHLGFAYFFCPTCAMRAVTRETRTSMQNGYLDPALNCVPCRYTYCALNGPCATRYGCRF